jgi:predicted amino acid dehydrogenase
MAEAMQTSVGFCGTRGYVDIQLAKLVRAEAVKTEEYLILTNRCKEVKNRKGYLRKKKPMSVEGGNVK